MSKSMLGVYLDYLANSKDEQELCKRLQYVANRFDIPVDGNNRQNPHVNGVIGLVAQMERR